jgi:hypothetical protein
METLIFLPLFTVRSQRFPCLLLQLQQKSASKLPAVNLRRALCGSECHAAFELHGMVGMALQGSTCKVKL